MRTSSVRTLLLTVCLLGLLVGHANADGGLLDLVRQTSQGITPSNFREFVPSSARIVVSLQGASAHMGTAEQNAVQMVGGYPVGGLSYVSANGFQWAATEAEVARTISRGYTTGQTVYSNAPKEFAPGWAAYTGMAFWSRIATYMPLWGMFMYVPQGAVTCPTCPTVN